MIQNTFRYNLPPDYYNNYLKRLDAVTIQDVLDVSKKYFTADQANIVVVGNKDEVAEKLLPFDGDGKIEEGFTSDKFMSRLTSSP